MKVLVVREKWDHMSNVSGFDPLFAAFERIPGIEVKSVYVNDTENFQLVKKSKLELLFSRVKLSLKLRLRRLLNKQIPPHLVSKPNFRISAAIQTLHELTFEIVLKEYQSQTYDYVIFSAADSQFVDGLYYSSKEFKNRSVLFFHQPPSWLKLYWSDFNVLNDFKAIVTLCDSSKFFFESIIKTPVFKINHGVNLSFFNIGATHSIGTTIRILFVGSWLRDFSLLFKVAYLLNLERFNFQLNCIIPVRDRHHIDLMRLSTFKNVNFYSNLTAEELKHAYQSNDLFFLPLIDSTANNGMNEALASGLPIVATKIGGVSDYLNGVQSFLAEPNNELDHVQQIKAAFLWMSENKNYKLSIRKHAEENLNWDLIALEFKNQVFPNI